MAELRTIDEKLAEVLGLAQAAKDATQKVARLAEDEEHQALLERMAEEAAQTAERCEAALDDEAFDGRKTAILEQARETRGEATEMMKTYLEGEDEALDGFEFLSMAEAGELCHWEILRTLNEKAGIAVVGRLTEEVLPIQQRHVAQVRDTALAIAGNEDPLETD